jgi:hypothetical protein
MAIAVEITAPPTPRLCSNSIVFLNIFIISQIDLQLLLLECSNMLEYYSRTRCMEKIQFMTDVKKVKHTQTLQILTMIAKIESTYKSY